jgi:hypothetical protein
VDSAEQAATECGAAPVTRSSGQTRGVYFRWAANTRARKAITSFAHNARMQDDWAAALYAGARARGKRHPHATRIVARAWLRVIWACWTSDQPYNPPERRRGQDGAPHARNDLDRAEHRHIMGSGGTVTIDDIDLI